MDTDEERALTRAAGHAVKWTDKRDQLIVDAYQRGAGLREIARAVNLSHPGVRGIILRRRGTLDRT